MADSLKDKLKTFLDQWGDKVQNSANKVIDETVNYDGGQSAELTKSVDFKVEAYESGRARFVLTMADYYQYIEYGRKKGKMPPSNKLEDFVRKRHLKLTPPKRLKGKDRSLFYDRQIKSLAFVIARSIGKKGVEPRPFLNKIITPELETELKDGLAKIFKEQVIIDLKFG